MPWTLTLLLYRITFNPISTNFSISDCTNRGKLARLCI